MPDLATVYTSNAVDDESRRSIPAAGKALNSRLLVAEGGQALIESAGFELQGDLASGRFICSFDSAMIGLSAAILKKGEAFWREVAGATLLQRNL
ncbi:MAG: hypothetical protein SGPRY_008619 [Prymnesium sp.]